MLVSGLADLLPGSKEEFVKMNKALKEREAQGQSQELTTGVKRIRLDSTLGSTPNVARTVAPGMAGGSAKGEGSKEK